MTAAPPREAARSAIISQPYGVSMSHASCDSAVLEVRAIAAQIDAAERALANPTASPSKLLESVTDVAALYASLQDGRLRAIIERGQLAIKRAYPGNWKQAQTSRTVRTAIDKLVWEHVAHRVRRFFAQIKRAA